MCFQTLLCLFGNRTGENRAFGIGFHLDFAAVLFHKTRNDAQAVAMAIGFGGEAGQEYLAEVAFGNFRAVVCHGE